MSIRNLFSCLLIVAASFTLGPRAFAQGEWAVEKTFHVGGEGGFDYITVDAKSHRLYVPRSTHTMVIDADSGNTVADITGQKHNHGVAVVPELARGFISDGAGSIVIFDLKTNAVLGTVAAKDDADGIVYGPTLAAPQRRWGMRERECCRAGNLCYPGALISCGSYAQQIALKEPQSLPSQAASRVPCHR